MSKSQYILDYAAWKVKSGQSQTLLTNNLDVPRYGTIQDSEAAPPPIKARTIGFWSAVFIIFNRIIGTGIFATPAAVLSLSGSVGLSMVLWLLGSLLAAAGMQVYIIWGCAFPKNGAEKNYLSYLFPKPSYLIICLYAASSSLMGWAAGNSLIFGEYTLKAFMDHEPSAFLLRLTSFLCITVTFLLHGTAIEWGLRVQNILGVFKLFVLAVVAATGLFALKYGIPTVAGVLDDSTLPSDPRWRGRENFVNMWEGTTVSASSLCLGLYSVIWSFIGFSNANYAMSEMKNPKRTIKIAGPLAVAVVAALYIFSNVAYISGASKDEIANSGRLIVALLMKNVWGEKIERFVDIGVALSAFGSVLAMSFAQGRVNQELGKEGVLPLSQLLASNKPFNAPLAGLGLHWFLCVLIILFVPQGDAYNLVINLASYPTAVINAIISFGLLYLYFTSSSHRYTEDEQYGWNKLSYYTLFATFFFGAANVFLFIAPFIPPPEGAEPYVSLPYWTHAVVGWILIGVGAAWWALKFRR
ncbi:High-affinity methionine permease [Leucoagaricus sp. SymC.cos]|nr:High-affinity methionine permease [Leucoagaricus sp. SymC.cos]